MQIVVSITDQKMGLWNDKLEKYEKIYNISTARNGPGEKMNSYCTPRGHAYVYEKIGANQDLGTYFVGRKPSNHEIAKKHSTIITTRILWLSGTMPGFNKGGNRDIKNRMIYIHGVPLPAPLPPHISSGCINMTDSDVLELFDIVEVGTNVTIYEQKLPKYYAKTGIGNAKEVRNYFPNVSSTAKWHWIATSTKNSSIVGCISVGAEGFYEIEVIESQKKDIEDQMLETLRYHCIAKKHPIPVDLEKYKQQEAITKTNNN